MEQEEPSALLLGLFFGQENPSEGDCWGQFLGTQDRAERDGERTGGGEQGGRGNRDSPAQI